MNLYFNSEAKQPRVIFWDAVGTLFGVRESVGDAYGLIASQFGVEAEAELLNQAFFQSFLAAPSMAFPGANIQDIPQLEFDWWEAIAVQTFQTVGVYENFTDFSLFFHQLYEYFKTEKPWFVYPDVIPTLQKYYDQGIELGIVSNFDSRLYPVLEALNLDQFFTTITISTEVGSAKPSPEIFQIALKKHHCSPEETWHIGDSFKADYQGAKAMGIRSFLINREEPLKGISDEYETLDLLPSWAESTVKNGND